jgi:hypothetical protein
MPKSDREHILEVGQLQCIGREASRTAFPAEHAGSPQVRHSGGGVPRWLWWAPPSSWWMARVVVVAGASLVVEASV